jgi:hypothetical protein
MTKSKKPVGTLRTLAADTTMPWLADLIARAAACSPTSHVRCIDPITLIRDSQYQVLSATANIGPHIDPDFPPWSYILVLRAADAILKTHGHEDLLLAPGMLVEFNAHRKHSLKQPTKNTAIWAPLDRLLRIDLPIALALIEHSIEDPFSMANNKLSETATIPHEVISDGRTVWIHDGAGAEIARFGVDGVEINMPIADKRHTGEPLSSLRTTPDRAAWREFSGIFHRLYGIRVEPDYRPIWL